MMHYETDQQYVPLKQTEMRRRADHFRLAKTARREGKMMTFRFYHRALLGLGRWLVVSGTRLQRRYGELTELPQTNHHRMPYERQV